ncbi:MAG: hypothetical protein JWO30_1394 [Fibrobacteres bacterium]|nr:hypothetical protein [Fibrobacterota bacterium]
MDYRDSEKEKGGTVKSFRWLCIAAAPALFQVSCNTEENSQAGTVFTCDARSTVAEICIEEPNDFNNQKASKSTCTSAGGSWSDAAVCPASYKKKCKDGDKYDYYYAKDDEDKDCSALVGSVFTLMSMQR